jgi:signal transduction histidine kinase
MKVARDPAASQAPPVPERPHGRDDTAAEAPALPSVGQAGRAAERAPVRPRLSVLLLCALLVTSLAMAGLTLYALRGERAELARTRQDSQQHLLALLGSRLEQVLIEAVQSPFLALRNIPVDRIDATRVAQLRRNFPAVQQLLVLDERRNLKRSLPAPVDAHERRVEQWLTDRVQEEDLDDADGNLVPFDTFVETVAGRPALIALMPVNETGATLPHPNGGADVDAGTDEHPTWLLMRFKLDVLRHDDLAPLLDGFTSNRGGRIALVPPETVIDGDAITQPLSRALPGWLLLYHPSVSANGGLDVHGWIVLAIAIGCTLAVALTSLAVWWDVRREYALVELRNRFVANVSHELKTPLTLLRMYAETLYLRRQPDPARQHEYHRVMLREAERLSHLIENVLDFDRLRRGGAVYRLTAEDLRATVQSVLDYYQQQYEERGLRFDISLQDELPPVRHDSSGVTQILLNLLENAARYAAEPGHVEIRLRHDGDWVDLEVADHGPGLSAEEYARLGKARKRGQLAESSRGSGIGLALVEQIARAHHAHFILDVPEGHSGVRAVVSFPAAGGRT